MSLNIKEMFRDACKEAKIPFVEIMAAADTSPINKLAEMVQGKTVIMTGDQLDLLCKFDLSNLIRSRPNLNQVGAKDQWECWIERRDLAKFNA